jgi:hypothetical protein
MSFFRHIGKQKADFIIQVVFKSAEVPACFSSFLALIVFQAGLRFLRVLFGSFTSTRVLTVACVRFLLPAAGRLQEWHGALLRVQTIQQVQLQQSWRR